MQLHTQLWGCRGPGAATGKIPHHPVLPTLRAQTQTSWPLRGGWQWGLLGLGTQLRVFQGSRLRHPGGPQGGGLTSRAHSFHKYLLSAYLCKALAEKMVTLLFAGPPPACPSSSSRLAGAVRLPGWGSQSLHMR